MNRVRDHAPRPSFRFPASAPRASTGSAGLESPHAWRWQWAIVTGTGALLVTTFDAALLERKYEVFGGGFQAADRLKGPAEILGFLATSILADVAVIGVLVAIGLWVCSHLRLRKAARMVLILTSAVAPILVMDFVAYQVLTYLGDAFEFWVMFDLAENNPRELFAVAGGHLLTPALIVVGMSLLVGCFVWLLNRYVPETPREPAAWAPARSRILLLAALTAVGLSAACLGRSSSDALDSNLRRKPSIQLLSHFVMVATDVDRDGYTFLSRRRDPDAWNAEVFPYAVDVPGNGIDENGVGGDLPDEEMPDQQSGHSAGPWQFKPDVVLVFLESVRADVLHRWHLGKPVTPVLNQLASRGVSAQFAFSHNGWTAQSRYHLFSGRLATIPNRTTLIDDFKANGYQVAYFSGQAESFGGDDLDVGFARADVAYDARVDIQRRYTISTSSGSLAVPLSVLQERINAFLDSRTSRAPLFLYVNFEDSHFPYYHSGIRPLISDVVLSRAELQPARAEDLRSMYLNTVANVDRAVGEVLDKTRRVLGKEPAIIVASDHGESLFEEGFLGHGYAINDAQTRIPLIATNLPMVIREPFGQADLRDTLRAAFSGAATTQSPSIIANGSRPVFQYLGTVEQPTQIAFTTTAGRTTYDLSRRQIRIGTRDWQRPEDLSAAESDAFRRLIHYWERLLLAGNATATGAGY
jgi:glucan phosphoethanolaminetransferase (alkaline phosphatase superfamily)